MKYFSEVLDRVFDTPAALDEAEAKHEAKLAEDRQKREAELARKNRLAAEKDSRKAEVDAAWDAAYKLQDKYVEDYGEYFFYKANIFWPFVK